MFEESKEMELIRKIREQHYEDARFLNSKQLIDFYKNKANEIQNSPKGIQVS